MTEDARWVEGLVHGDPGVGQDTGGLPVSGLSVGDVISVRSRCLA
jgi:hypothetical protein